MDYLTNDTDLTSVADAIRTKGGTSSPLTYPAGFVSAIAAIPTGSPDTWTWMGKNPTRIYQSSVSKVYFKNTGWNTWSPTTTQTKLDDPATVTTFAADTEHYEYWVHYVMYEELAYTGSPTNKGRLNKALTEWWGCVVRYANNRANLAAGTRNYNYAVSVYTQPVMDYYNTSGNLAITYSWGYGIYPSAAVPTFSSSTSLTPTVTVRSPTIYARCHDSYLTTANAALVDKNNSFYQIQYEVWRIDVESSGLRVVQDDRMDVYRNGLS